LMWTFPDPRDGCTFTSSPEVSGSVFIADSCGRVFALNPSTGKLAWKSDKTSVVYAVAGGRVFTANGSALYSLNTTTGSVLWRYLGESYFDGLSVGGNVLVATTSGGKLVGIDAKSGKILWSLSLPRSRRQQYCSPLNGPYCTPILPGGYVLVSTNSSAQVYY
jgi:outer membrane protein assembly factor BamB